MRIAIAALLALLVAATRADAEDGKSCFQASKTSTVTSTVVALEQKMPMVTPTNRNIAKLAVFALLVAATVAGTEEKKPSFGASKTSTVTSTVMAVDQKTRMAKLANEDGELTVKADTRIKNLEEVKLGDVVTATVTESISGRVLKKGESIPNASEGPTTPSAPLGAKPAGHSAKEVCAIATIAALDKDSGVITLTGPKGNRYPIQARDKETVDKLEVGDKVEVHPAQAIGIEVTSAR